MKEISIIVISILLVVIGSNISLGYITKTGGELITETEKLREEIKKAQNNEENNSKELANEIFDKWEKEQKKLSIIIAHSELDKIEVALVTMRICIEEKEYEKSIEELEKFVFILESIQTKEELKIQNIF